MFLVKRRSDGKYFMNPGSWGYGRHTREAFESLWTENLQECKPYKTTGGARSSLPAGKWSEPTKIRRAKWDEKYELVQVHLKLEVG